MISTELRETLAAIEHERWSSWQQYVHTIGYRQDDGSVLLPVKLVAHWERQIDTPYADLTAVEQASDLEQVDCYWSHIQALFDRIAALEAAARAVLRDQISVRHEVGDCVCLRCGAVNIHAVDCPVGTLAALLGDA